MNEMTCKKVNLIAICEEIFLKNKLNKHKDLNYLKEYFKKLSNL